MEVVLHSVLLRQEQMVMQWDAEFEQQKQLFHMNTSALIDMLPVRPRKKRLKVEIPSQHDKENLVVCAKKCPKTTRTRGLAKRDLNTRFCDNSIGAKAAAALDAEPTGRGARAVRRGNQVPVNVVVDLVDERPSSSPGENRKRIHEDNVAIQESKELSSNPEEVMAAEDAAEKDSKPKRARVIAEAKKDAAEVGKPADTHVARPEIAVNVEVEAEERACRDSQAVEVTAEPEIPSKQPARRGRAKKTDAPENVVKEPAARRGRAKKAPAAAVPAIAPRVTRSRARKVESVVEAESMQINEEVAADAPPKVEKDGDTEGRSANPMEAVCEPRVCAPVQEVVTRDEPSVNAAGKSKVRNPAPRSRKKCTKSSSVALDIEERASLPEPRLERIEEAVGQPEAEHLCKGPKVEDDSAPSAPPGEEDPSRNAAPERDALVEDRTKEGSLNQVAKTADGRRASNRKGVMRPSRAQRVSTLRPLAKDAPPKSDASNSGVVSEAVPTNTQASYTTLLSEMIQGSIPPPETVGCSEAMPSKSSLRSGGLASAATAVELTGASRDGSASQSEARPNAGTLNRKSTVEDGRDGSGEEVVEGQGVECEDVLEECSIEANIQFAERSWHAKGDSVVNSASEVSRVKEAENVMQSRDGAASGGTREQVKSGAISPVRYSEARAREEAMRCSLEQEFHPDVTLTLNRWQFRRRLSPRSKARARRWRSDVATNGVEYGRVQSTEAPAAASPSRAVSSRDRSMEGAAYETFLEAQSPIPDAALGTEKTVDDGEMGDNSVEYEVMGAADEAENLSPLLRSIYKLSKACEKDMVGVDEILEEDEQQQVHSLIESAKKIVEQVSSKRAQASGAPGCDEPSSRFYDHTNLYPDRFRLFNSPRASGAAPASARRSFPVSRTPVVAFLIAGDLESISPRTKQETMAEAASRSADRDSTVSESAAVGDDVVSCELGEGEGVRDCYDVRDQGAIVGGDSAIDAARAPRGSHDDCALQPCEGSMPRIKKQIRAVDIAELVMHASEVALSSGTVMETEKLSQLKSRFHALSKDYMVGTTSVAKDAANLINADLISSIKRSSSRPSVIPSLRFSPGYASEKRKHVKESPQRVDVDTVEDGEPDVYVEGKIGIPCSPISIGNQRGPGKAPQALVAEESSLSHHGVEMTWAIEEEVVVLEDEEPVSPSQSMASASAASTLRVEPQRPSNLVGAAFGSVSSSSNIVRSNLVANIRSFVPLVQQHQPAAPYPNGKRDVKVKALEAAEAAKRLAELKELEKQERKKAAEIAKREKQERAAQEKLAKREKAAQDKLMKEQEKENEEASKRKAAGGCGTKSVMADSTNSQGTSSQNVLFKVKKTYELKQKMDQEKQERLQEEQRRKEEEWKKKEAENAARKRKHEAAEKKEREEKRRRQEEAVKAQREMEDRQRLELEKKAQKQKAMEEMEKERKAIEDELKRMKRLDKEREVEQRRKKEQEKEVAWLDQKGITRKQREEAAKLMKLLETEGRLHAGKMRRPSDDPAGAYHSVMSTFHAAAMGIAEDLGAGLLSGAVNNLVDAQRVSSQSLVGHSLRVPQQSGEGVGAACRNSQAALRVPGTTPESGDRGVSNLVEGTGKPLVWITPQAQGASTVTCGEGARVLRESANGPQVQSGSRTGALPAVAGGSKPGQPGQAGFAGPPGGVVGHGDKGVQTYEISPYRDSEDEDSDEEEKRSLKPIPQWARRENMWPQLVRQLQQDPDDIFVGANSCSLDEVFEVKGSKKRPCFKRRGSSGDWVKDCLTWQEQNQYKVAMGYLD